MKKYIYLSIAIIIVILVLIISILSSKINNLNKEISIYDNNFKALNLEKNSLKQEVIAYRFDLEQLEYINDSIIKDLNNTRKQLKIKDKEILQMQSIITELSTKDSIFIKDTIFSENFVRLDTTITDKWHSIKLTLLPSKVVIDAKYTSDLKVFAKSSKEIIGTPKKCWLGRLLQKKQKVVRVNVHDNNPYSKIKESKFVIIE